MNPIANWFHAARWVITAIALAALAGVIGWQQLRIAHLKLDVADEKVQVSQRDTQISQMIAQHAQQREQDQKQARAAEQSLRDSANEIRKQSDEQVASALARADDLARQLRSRPSRPAGSSNGSAVAAAGAAAAGATGAQLYLQDGQFLAGEAARAERVLIERDECRRLYDEAREKLKTGQGVK
jgi:TolA-binding protein